MLVACTLAVLLGAAPLEPPGAFVRRGLDEVRQVATQPEPSVHRLAERALTLFDFETLTRRAYGDDWSALDPDRQKALTRAVSDLLTYSYAKKALEQPGPPPAVEVGVERITGDEASVLTTVVVGAQSHRVEYRLARRGPKAPWRVFDVVTEDASLLEAWRAQFARLLAAGGPERLLATLRERLAPLKPLMSEPRVVAKKPSHARPSSEADALKASGLLFGVTRGILDTQSPFGGD